MKAKFFLTLLAVLSGLTQTSYAASNQPYSWFSGLSTKAQRAFGYRCSGSTCRPGKRPADVVADAAGAFLLMGLTSSAVQSFGPVKIKDMLTKAGYNISNRDINRLNLQSFNPLSGWDKSNATATRRRFRGSGSTEFLAMRGGSEELISTGGLGSRLRRVFRCSGGGSGMPSLDEPVPLSDDQIREAMDQPADSTYDLDIADMDKEPTKGDVVKRLLWRFGKVGIILAILVTVGGGLFGGMIKDIIHFAKDIMPTIDDLKKAIQGLIAQVEKQIPKIKSRAAVIKADAKNFNIHKFKQVMQDTLCLTIPVWEIVKDIDNTLVLIDKVLSTGGKKSNKKHYNGLIHDIADFTKDLYILMYELSQDKTGYRIRHKGYDKIKDVINVMSKTVPAIGADINQSMTNIQSGINIADKCKATVAVTQPTIDRAVLRSRSVDLASNPISSSPVCDKITCKSKRRWSKSDVIKDLKEFGRTVDDVVGDITSTVTDLAHDIKSAVNTIQSEAIKGVKDNIKKIKNDIAVIKDSLRSHSSAAAGQELISSGEVKLEEGLDSMVEFTKGLFNLIDNALDIMKDIVDPFKAIDKTLDDVLTNICTLLGDVGASGSGIAKASNIVGPCGIEGIADELSTGLSDMEGIFSVKLPFTSA